MRFWRRQPAQDEAPAAGAEAHDFTPEQAEELQQHTQRAVERSRSSLFGRIGSLFERSDFDEELWEELEELLIAGDTGMATTERILADVRAQVRETSAKRADEVREILRDELIAILEEPAARPPRWDEAFPDLLVLLVVGVNGAGKTTSIAKLAAALKEGDTPRSSAPPIRSAPPRSTSSVCGATGWTSVWLRTNPAVILRRSRSIRLPPRRAMARTWRSSTPPAVSIRSRT